MSDGAAGMSYSGRAQVLARSVRLKPKGLEGAFRRRARCGPGAGSHRWWDRGTLQAPRTTCRGQRGSGLPATVVHRNGQWPGNRHLRHRIQGAAIDARGAGRGQRQDPYPQQAGTVGSPRWARPRERERVRSNRRFSVMRVKPGAYATNL